MSTFNVNILQIKTYFRGLKISCILLDKLNLKEFLQEQRRHSTEGTCAILRSFSYTSLISNHDMIW